MIYFILFLSDDIMQAQSCHITLAKVLLNPYHLLIFIDHVNIFVFFFFFFRISTIGNSKFCIFRFPATQGDPRLAGLGD